MINNRPTPNAKKPNEALFNIGLILILLIVMALSFGAGRLSKQSFKIEPELVLEFVSNDSIYIEDVGTDRIYKVAFDSVGTAILKSQE